MSWEDVGRSRCPSSPRVGRTVRASSIRSPGKGSEGHPCGVSRAPRVTVRRDHRGRAIGLPCPPTTDPTARAPVRRRGVRAARRWRRGPHPPSTAMSGMSSLSGHGEEEGGDKPPSTSKGTKAFLAWLSDIPDPHERYRRATAELEKHQEAIVQISLVRAQAAAEAYESGESVPRAGRAPRPQPLEGPPADPGRKRDLLADRRDSVGLPRRPPGRDGSRTPLTWSMSCHGVRTAPLTRLG